MISKFDLECAAYSSFYFAMLVLIWSNLSLLPYLLLGGHPIQIVLWAIVAFPVASYMVEPLLRDLLVWITRPSRHFDNNDASAKHQ
jgi:hypothetical protein